MGDFIWQLVLVVGAVGSAIAVPLWVWTTVRRRLASTVPTKGRRFLGDLVLSVVRERQGSSWAYVARGRFRDGRGRRHRRSFAKAFLLDSTLSRSARQRLEAEGWALDAIDNPFVSRRLIPQDLPPDGSAMWRTIHQTYVPGPSLAAHLADEGSRLGPDDQVALFLALADGLRAAHAAGVVHCDVKPANVVVTEDGPVITDLGSAKVRDEQGRTMSGTGLGGTSQEFGAPEQLAVPPRASEASDIFSLGLVMTYALVGEPTRPTPAEPLGAAARPAADVGIADLLAGCLDPVEASRPTAADLAGELHERARHRAGLGPSASTSEIVRALWSPRPARPRVGVGAVDLSAPLAAVLMVVVLCSALVVGRPQPTDADEVAGAATTTSVVVPSSTRPPGSTTTTADPTTSTSLTSTTPATPPPSATSTAPRVTEPTGGGGGGGSGPGSGGGGASTSGTSTRTTYCDREPIPDGTTVGAPDRGVLEWNDVWDGSPSDMAYDVYWVDFDCVAHPAGRIQPHGTLAVEALSGQMIEWRYTRDGVGEGSESIRAGGWAGTLHLTGDDDRAWVPYGCC